MIPRLSHMRFAAISIRSTLNQHDLNERVSQLGLTAIQTEYCGKSVLPGTEDLIEAALSQGSHLYNLSGLPDDKLRETVQNHKLGIIFA